MSTPTSALARYAALVPQLTVAEEFVRDAVPLAFEEAFVNVCSYAYPDESGEVEVQCVLRDDGFALIVSDEGTHLIRKLAHSVTYAREGNRNVLTLVFRTA